MKKLLGYFIITLVIFLLFVSCSSKKDTSSTATSLLVTAFKVPEPKNLPVELQYPGKTKSISKVTITARITGFLEKMYFKEGEWVKKGTLLFLIEPDVYQAEYESAKAQLERAKAQLEKAERDWKRIKSSFEDRVVSEEERDRALFSYQSALAEFKNAQARLKQAEINLKYTKVLATTSGIVGERLVDIGNLVNPGTPLVTITEIDPIYVEFSFPDKDLLKLEGEALKEGFHKLKGLKVELLLENGEVYSRKGYIDFVDAVIDEKTSSIKARAVFPNPERKLLPGQFVRIKVKGLTRPKAIVVPQKAVMQTPLGTTVYVVEKERAVSKIIKVGEKTGEYFIVEEGLKPGELVILDQLMKLRPDTLVKIEKIVEEK